MYFILMTNSILAGGKNGGIGQRKNTFSRALVNVDVHLYSPNKHAW